MANAARAVVEEEQESTDLMVMASVNPLAIFTDEQQFSAFYEKMKAETAKHVPDVSTVKGRVAVRKLASGVTKAKTTLEKAGLRLTEEWRRQTAVVTAARKKMVDELDQLAKEVRAPLTEWEEAEKARVARCRAVIDELKAAAVITIEDTSDTVRARGKEVWEVEIGDEFGDMAAEAESVKETAVATLGRALNRLIQEEADRAELQRLRAEAEEREAREAAEREEREQAERDRLAAEEAERRRVEAEEAEAERIREAAERAAQEARDEEARKAREAEEARQREHEAALAEERRQREDAERIAREEREARERADAEREAEAARVEAERVRQAEEDRKREANRAHRTRVQAAAKAAIMACGVDEPTAVAVVKAIVAGRVPAVTLAF
jgi:colicin import membrane protein